MIENHLNSELPNTKISKKIYLKDVVAEIFEGDNEKGDLHFLIYFTDDLYVYFQSLCNKCQNIVDSGLLSGICLSCCYEAKK